jgi:hypothetical protein
VNTHPDYAAHRDIAAWNGYRGVESTPLFDRQTGEPVGISPRCFESHTGRRHARCA